MKNETTNKFNKVAVVLLLLGVGIGLLVTAQWKTPVVRVSNPITPYISLRDTRDNLIEEQDDLKKQISGLQYEISQIEAELKKYNTNKKTIEEIEDLKKKVGLVEKRGEGVIVKFDDSKIDEITNDSITHAADLRDIVNFLWGVGAEAISINDQRMVFATSIDCIVNTILINSTKTVPPFEIKVIGPAKNLEQQIVNSESLKDIKKRVKNQNLIFAVEKKDDIVILGYDGSFVTDHINSLE